MNRFLAGHSVLTGISAGSGATAGKQPNALPDCIFPDLRLPALDHIGTVAAALPGQSQLDA